MIVLDEGCVVQTTDNDNETDECDEEGNRECPCLSSGDVIDLDGRSEIFGWHRCEAWIWLQRV